MRVLVTGANGYVGARLMKDLSNRYEVHGTYHKSASAKLLKADITNRDEIEAAINKIRPEFIVHAAAVVGQKLCEDNPELAQSVNVEGTKNVALGANGVGAGMIHISTGAVLNLGPNGLYGKTKLEAEKALMDTADRYVILRPGMVMGDSPQKREDSFQNQLMNNIMGKTQAAYDNVYRYQITWIGYISEIISAVAKRDLNGEILPIVARDPKTKYEIARDILKNFGAGVVPTKEREPVERKFQTVDKLQELNMPIYTYQAIVEKVVQEIRDQLNSKTA